MRRRAAAVAALLVTLIASRAAAEPEPPTRLTVPVTCRDGADPPHELRLDPGYYLTEETWTELDREMRRLQERETRLAAENESLRESAREGRLGWVLGAIGGIAAGAAAGWFLL